MSACYVCNKNFLPEQTFFNVLGKSYHNTCFQCSKCRTSMLDGSFVEYGNEPFCVTCSRNLFMEKCDKCGLEIDSKKVEISKDTAHYVFHLKCFECTKCSQLLSPTLFYWSAELKPICIGCNSTKKLKFTVTNCSKCNLPITESPIYKISGKPYHQSCIKCSLCNCAIAQGQFTADRNLVACPTCASTCGTCLICKNLIIGQSLIVFQKNFHLNCLKCGKCSLPIKPEDQLVLQYGEIIHQKCSI